MQPAERAAEREVIDAIERTLDRYEMPVYDIDGERLYSGPMHETVDTKELARLIFDGLQADPITRPALRLIVGGAG